MQVINWLDLQPLPAEVDALNGRLHEALPLRSVCRLLVETTLRAYPWKGRADLVSSYHPSQTYKQGQRVALFISDPRNVHPTVWFLTQVKDAKAAENRVQGPFQVLTLDLQGRQIQMAAGIPNASYMEPDLSDYSSQDLVWLVEWVSKTYATALEVTLRKLIQKGQLCGRIVGDIFLPEGLSALSPELLHPVFDRISAARPWISLDEIVQGLPDLSPLKRETVLGLLSAALKQTPYRSLGAGRWTTPELLDGLDHDVAQGLPAPQIRLDMPIWTKQDEQDLAGYDRKFMPAEARGALEELGFVERLPEADESAWRLPKDPVRLPALSYLQLTQAYVPVGSVLRLFAPDVKMVFVQFISGAHQPFLLDREKGLLKAADPEALRSRILNEGLPAGTHMWIEYEGNEQYRIVPRRVAFKRLVPCKLANLGDDRLHIQHTHISMTYEGDRFLFKTDMLSEEIEAFIAEAGRAELSLRDAMVYALQELCATDPDHRAHRSDLFNAVFLQRMCSPQSVSLLLYTQPCFEQLGGGYFRYKPAPVAPVKTRRKRKDRLSKLWDNLLSDPLPPNPRAEERTTIVGGREGSYSLFPTSTPDLALAFPLSEPEAEPEFSMLALPLVAVEEEAPGGSLLKEETRFEALLVSQDEPDLSTPTDATQPAGHDWRGSLDMLLHSLEDLVTREPSALPDDEANPETEASSEVSVEAAHEESLSFASPFRWDPKPAWIDSPVRPKAPLPDTVDARRLVYIPKIPVRPLHKQPFYRRLFYYLRGWLSRIFRKSV